MATPTWRLFFIRVGGVTALFVVAILFTRAYFPNYVGHVVGVVAVAVLCAAFLEEWFQKSGAAKKEK